MTRPHCQQPDACRATTDRHCHRCNAIASMARINSDPEIQARVRKASSARMKARHAVEIPRWVPLPLHRDYRAVAVRDGEEAAASHARAVLRELRGAQ